MPPTAPASPWFSRGCGTSGTDGRSPGGEDCLLGTIGLKGLEIVCVIGAYDEERLRRQPLRLNIAMTSDFGHAAAEDRLAQTIDYGEVARLLTDMAENGRFHLIETFAERAAAELFDRFPGLREVELEVEKPQAIPAADFAFVRVHRTR